MVITLFSIHNKGTNLSLDVGQVLSYLLGLKLCYVWFNHQNNLALDLSSHSSLICRFPFSAPFRPSIVAAGLLYRKEWIEAFLSPICFFPLGHLRTASR